MIKWIEEALKEEKDKWECHTAYGKDLMRRMLVEYKNYSVDQIKVLSKEIEEYINNDENPKHDKTAIEGMSHFFFEHIVPWETND